MNSRRDRYVHSVERAMGLLEVITERGSARLVDLAAQSALGKATVHGLLDTLLAMGYVAREGTRYVPGARLHTLAPPPGAHERLLDAFRPAMAAFNDLCGENTVLAVPGGTRAYVTLDGRDTNGHLLALPPDDTRDAMHTSAVGKLFLAHDARLLRSLAKRAAVAPSYRAELDTIRDRGFALDTGTSQVGLNCVAIPLRVRGKVVAALGAGGAEHRFGRPLMERMAGRTLGKLCHLVRA